MAEAESKRDEIIVLFDVDGTLTPARKVGFSCIDNLFGAFSY